MNPESDPSTGLIHTEPPHGSVFGDEAQGRGERARRNIYTSLMLKVVTTTVGFLKVPLLFGTLGPSRYGFWVAVLGLMQYGTMGDVGVQYAVTQAVAEARGEGRLADIRAVVATGFWLTSAVVAVIAMVVVAAVLLLSPLTVIAQRSGVGVDEGHLLLLVGVLCMLLLQPSKVLYAAEAGFERIYALNIWDCIQSIAGFIGLAIVLSITDELIVIGAWIVGWDLVCAWGVATVLTARREHISMDPRTVRLSGVAPLMRSARNFFLTTVGNAFRGPVINVFVITMIGAAALARYSVTLQVILIGLAIAPLIAGNLWPAYAQSVKRDDWAWVNRVSRQASLLLLALGGFISVIAVALGKDFIIWWTGPEGFAGEAVLWWLVGWFFLEIWNGNVGQLIISFGRSDVIVRCAFAQTFVTLVAVLLAAPVWGLPGVAAGAFIGAALGGTIPLTLSVARTSGSRVSLPGSAFARVLGVAVVVGALSFLARSLLSEDPLPLPWIAAGTIVVGTVATLAIALVGMSRDDRDTLLAWSGVGGIVSRVGSRSEQ